MGEVIRSAQNPKVKRVKKLLSDASARREEGLWVCEGVRLAEEALASGLEIQAALVTEGVEGERLLSIAREAASRGAETIELANGVMKELSETQNPQGIALLVGAPRHSIDKIAILEGPLLILDELRDPGNLGALARTALALGAVGMVAARGTVDAGNPKALRASMGALLRIPFAIGQIDAEAKALLKRPFFATTGEGGVAPEMASLGGSFGLILGQEAAGISPELLLLADHRLSIPMEGGVESLNVAAAASAILFEASRQRRALAFKD